MLVAVYDTKPYDREYLGAASAKCPELTWKWREFRLSAETADTAKGADAVCAFVNDQLDRACLEALAAQGVKLVALRCTGFNNVDVAAAREFGVAVTRVPKYSPYAVAEHAVALLLTLNRRVHRAYNRVRELNFSLAGLVGFDLHGKTAGLIGTGKIGKVMGQILRGFGMQVLAHDPYPDADWARTHDVRYTTADEVFRGCDVVSLHVALTPETRYLVCRKSIESMKRGAILINVSRGALVDTKALIEGLKSGRLGGVGLDVYEEEEGIFFEDLSGQVLQDDDLARLLTFPNVLITAHQAFLTREALNDIARVTLDNLRALASGQPFLEGTAVA